MKDEGGRYDFESFFADYYDLTPAYAMRGDLGFYTGCSKAAQGRTLELGCGTGRIIIPIARAGCGVVGLDYSKSMLSRCEKKLQDEPQDVQERVTTVRGDMTDFDLKERFHLITAPFRSFSHLVTVEEQLSCLDCVHKHLLPNGRFVLELFQMNPGRIKDSKYLNEAEDTPEFTLPDGRRLSRTNRTTAFHRAEQFNDVELIYHVTHPDGHAERLVQAFPFRYYCRFEVEHLLARSGLEILDLFGDFDKSPLTDDSPEMIFVAESRR
ncbi:class I SAM-dependent methyltransferase [bacterium]|nr:class I SAM-dependent methyltransferase [bacterium]